jgi:hypothetical protein
MVRKNEVPMTLAALMFRRMIRCYSLFHADKSDPISRTRVGIPRRTKRARMIALEITSNPDIRGVWRRALILGLDPLRSQALPLTNRKEKVSERRY